MSSSEVTLLIRYPLLPLARPHEPDPFLCHSAARSSSSTQSHSTREQSDTQERGERRRAGEAVGGAAGGEGQVRLKAALLFLLLCFPLGGHMRPDGLQEVFTVCFTQTGAVRTPRHIGGNLTCGLGKEKKTCCCPELASGWSRVRRCERSRLPDSSPSGRPSAPAALCSEEGQSCDFLNTQTYRSVFYPSFNRVVPPLLCERRAASRVSVVVVIDMLMDALLLTVMWLLKHSPLEPYSSFTERSPLVPTGHKDTMKSFLTLVLDDAQIPSTSLLDIHSGFKVKLFISF